jgi:hypothetical protein
MDVEVSPYVLLSESLYIHAIFAIRECVGSKPSRLIFGKQEEDAVTS